MLKDILGQAWEAMLYNRRRTTITMIGMAWGVATVVLLLPYGAGFSRAFEAIFAEFGTRTIGAFPGRTALRYGYFVVCCCSSSLPRSCHEIALTAAPTTVSCRTPVEPSASSGAADYLARPRDKACGA